MGAKLSCFVLDRAIAAGSSLLLAEGWSNYQSLKKQVFVVLGNVHNFIFIGIGVSVATCAPVIKYQVMVSCPASSQNRWQSLAHSPQRSVSTGVRYEPLLDAPALQLLTFLLYLLRREIHHQHERFIELVCANGWGLSEWWIG